MIGDYAYKHNGMKVQKAITPERVIISDDGIKRLACAVIEKAVADWRKHGRDHRLGRTAYAFLSGATAGPKRVKASMLEFVCDLAGVEPSLIGKALKC